MTNKDKYLRNGMLILILCCISFILEHLILKVNFEETNITRFFFVMFVIYTAFYGSGKK